MIPIPEKIKTLKKTTVCRKVDNEMVIVPVVNQVAEMKVIYTLNEPGTLIWELIDTAQSAEEIALRLTEAFEVDMPTATEDVVSFFEELIQKSETDS